MTELVNVERDECLLLVEIRDTLKEILLEMRKPSEDIAEQMKRAYEAVKPQRIGEYVEASLLLRGTPKGPDKAQ